MEQNQASFIAHINKETGAEQACTEHCRNTAKYAAKDLADISLQKSAYLAGLCNPF
ncbi:MAG: hypothetical protein IJI41_05075 [Anaerolineaceae bacterium]|nr:hypothetical protein [Anaerolineaceae bacterium]